MTAAALGSVAVSDAGEYADLAAALCLVVAASMPPRLARRRGSGGRPALPAGARRLHGRRRGDHDLLAVREADRVPSDAERLGPQVMELLRNLDAVHGPTLVLGLTTLVVMLVVAGSCAP